MSDFDINAFLENYSEEKDEATIENLVSKAEELEELEAAIKELEDSLSALNQQKIFIAQKVIPDMMEELGIKTFELKDGNSIKVKDFINGSLPKDPIAFQQALDWLIENGLESIIKTDVNLKFGKGEEEEAKEAIDMLKGMGYEPSEKYGVHPQTLSSSIKELVASGADVPFEMLGLYRGKKAEIKVVKKK